MEFWVTLIKIMPTQSVKARRSLKANCTFIDGHFWFFEGNIGCLFDDGVKFTAIGMDAVPSLGGLSKKELTNICEDIFGVKL